MFQSARTSGTVVPLFVAMLLNFVPLLFWGVTISGGTQPIVREASDAPCVCAHVVEGTSRPD